MITTKDLDFGREPETSGKRTEGASLTNDEIEKMMASGEIELKDLPIHERDKHRYSVKKRSV